jgi:peptidoglycan-associated lipoprotein
MRKNDWLVIGLTMIFAFAFFTVSCAKKNVVQKTQPEVSQASDRSVGDSERDDQPQTQTAPSETAGTEFIDENIHFAYNSSVLSDQAQMILNSQAQYLLFNPGAKVTVEGHCDERGTDAYNMVLGERRAESVKNYLVDLGISAERLNTISYGEERPIIRGQNEASWAQNRRAQFANN